jgi:hypothetical protein
MEPNAQEDELNLNIDRSSTFQFLPITLLQFLSVKDYRPTDMCVSTYASNIVCRLFLRHAMSLATYSSQPSSIIL